MLNNNKEEAPNCVSTNKYYVVTATTSIQLALQDALLFIFVCIIYYPSHIQGILSIS